MTEIPLRRARIVTLVLIGLATAGCSGEAPGASPTPTVSDAAPADRHGTVTVDGFRIAYACRGEGSPAVVLEAGSDSAGTTSFPPALLDPIADVTTVCTYNRLGTGRGSDGPPDSARTFDDLVAVLDGTLTALALEPPYVISGQSGGGNVAIAYARAHPDRVAALIPIEAYRDDPAATQAWQAEEGFTWADNPEHVDVVQASIAQAAYEFPLGDFPVLVISATNADPGGPENQAQWLAISPDSRQVVIEGPHDLQVSAPGELAAQIVAVLAEIQ